MIENVYINVLQDEEYVLKKQVNGLGVSPHDPSVVTQQYRGILSKKTNNLIFLSFLKRRGVDSGYGGGFLRHRPTHLSWTSQDGAVRRHQFERYNNWTHYNSFICFMQDG